MEYPLFGLLIGLFLGMNVGIITMAMFNAALRDEPSEAAPGPLRADQASGPALGELAMAGIGVGRNRVAVAGRTDPPDGVRTSRARGSA